MGEHSSQQKKARKKTTQALKNCERCSRREDAVVGRMLREKERFDQFTNILVVIWKKAVSAIMSQTLAYRTIPWYIHHSSEKLLRSEKSGLGPHPYRVQFSLLLV
ncbi:hypothetical protein PoB_002698100 [Plakobranchus ocellatus]|uniref:Uncharacterized protein n=1 Tax=Plakobranchus ocellatus TaxID=259542 RepID=A0AAV3ZN07_9GAST|nr:hypothetical protein PoB_002698100 [Plakobranchus ocellatus]